MRLDIQLGANADGLKSVAADVERITSQIEKKFAATAASTLKMSSNISAVGSRIGDFSSKIESALGRIKFGQLSAENKQLAESVSKTVSTIGTLADVTVAASGAWGVLTTGASFALSKIAALIPPTASAISSLAGPIGIIVGVGVAGAVALASNWDKFTNSLTRAQEIERQASESIVDQQAKVRRLVTVVQDQTLAYNYRNNSLKELQGISPTYFGNLSLEESSLSKINGQLVNYNKNLLAGAKLKVLKDEAEQATIKLQGLEKQLEKEKNRKVSSIVNPLNLGFTDNQSQTISLRYLNNEIEKTKKELKELETQASKISFNVDFAKVQNSVSQTQAPKKNKSIFEEYIKDLKQIQLLVDEGLINPLAGASQQAAISDAALKRFGSFTINEFKKINIELEKSNALISSFGAITPAPIKSISFKDLEIPKIKLDGIVTNVEAKSPIITKNLDLQGLAAISQQASGYVTQGITAVGDLVSASISRRGQEIEDFYSKERRGIENSLASAAVKERKLQILEEQTAAKRRKIAREQAAVNKKVALFTAIINGAAAVIKGLADGGIVQGIAAGAIAAAQIAVIASQPLPALAGGGVVSKDTIVRVGEYPGAKSNPEIVAPQNLLTNILRKELKNNNQDRISGINTNRGLLEITTDISSDNLRLLHRFQEYKSSRVRVG